MSDELPASAAVFQNELAALINKYSKEARSDTPDFVLAQYLENCLDAFSYAVRYRESCRTDNEEWMQWGNA